jgi:hypothetical protein
MAACLRGVDFVENKQGDLGRSAYSLGWAVGPGCVMTLRASRQMDAGKLSRLAKTLR